MDITFGIEQMVTQTTFVRDEKLKQYHDDFESCISSDGVFKKTIRLEENYQFQQINIDRGHLPRGSQIFQTVLAEFKESKLNEHRRKLIEQCDHPIS